jgi:hypothetical protein
MLKDLLHILYTFTESGTVYYAQLKTQPFAHLRHILLDSLHQRHGTFLYIAAFLYDTLHRIRYVIFSDVVFAGSFVVISSLI